MEALHELQAPGAVVVPLSTPVGLSVRPGGAGPVASDQVYGGTPPVALKVCEYGPGMVGGSGDGLVIVSGAIGAFTVSENALVA